MPRTALTKTRPVGGHGQLSPVAAGGAKVTMAAADTGNNNKFAMSGQDLLIALNTDSVDHTVTIHSVADNEGRTGDIGPYTLHAGELHAFGPFPVGSGWTQSDGTVSVDGSSALVFFGVLIVAQAV